MRVGLKEGDAVPAVASTTLRLHLEPDFADGFCPGDRQGTRAQLVDVIRQAAVQLPGPTADDTAGPERGYDQRAQGPTRDPMTC